MAGDSERGQPRSVARRYRYGRSLMIGGCRSEVGDLEQPESPSGAQYRGVSIVEISGEDRVEVVQAVP